MAVDVAPGVRVAVESTGVGAVCVIAPSRW
jgi:hypothetical protein